MSSPRCDSNRCPTTHSIARRALSALLVVALAGCAAACSNDPTSFASLPLPFEIAPARQGAPSARPKSGDPPLASNPKNLPSDCDELPDLTPEELAGPPYHFDLQKAAQPEPSGYVLLDGVSITKTTADALEKLDAGYFKKTGTHLIITSGTRDPLLQAKAMYKTMQLGTDILKLYRNRQAAQEIKTAYSKSLHRGREKTIEAIYEVIRDQLERGIYISAHLRAGAVDVRNRTMSRTQKKAFEKSVQAGTSFSFIEETKPPHFHLELLNP